MCKVPEVLDSSPLSPKLTEVMVSSFVVLNCSGVLETQDQDALPVTTTSSHAVRDVAIPGGC